MKPAELSSTSITSSSNINSKLLNWEKKILEVGHGENTQLYDIDYSSDDLSNYNWSSESENGDDEDGGDTFVHLSNENNIDLFKSHMVHPLNNQDIHEFQLCDEDTDQVNKEKEKNDQVEPQNGMCFNSQEEAYDFYNQYALAHGFSIRKYRSRRKGEIFYRTFCCSREGQKWQNEIRDEPNNPRNATRTGCLAAMNVRRIAQGPWEVHKFVKEHNHELLLPSQAFTLRSHRNVKSSGMDNVIDLTERAGIKPRFSFQYMSSQIGGPQNLGFLPQDHLNFIHGKRKKIMEKGEAFVIMKYLKEKQTQDRSFTFDMQLDEEEKITNIFWADGKAIMDYHFFGDVVCFDTTYKTNKYGRPLGVFVGVNHHRKTVVFGAALLFDESIPSFVWLFSTFVKTMLGKEPKTILTDQDAAMDAAIRYALPNTCHRLCVWHLYQNACKKLKHVFNRNIGGKKPFKKDFSNCIYQCQEETEFEVTWNELITKYGLQDNDWMNRLYLKRNKWALVYGLQSFSGGMQSTQRSESLNRKLKTYLNTGQNILQFFHQYDLLIADLRYKEFLLDCKSISSIFKPNIPSPILMQIASIYTYAAYKMVQDEFVHVCNVRLLNINTNGSLKECIIGGLNGLKLATVTFDIASLNVSCTCKTFEFRGHLCRHIFFVFQNEGVMAVPTAYILRRWTKNVKDEIKLDQWDTRGLSKEMVKARRSNDLHALFWKIVNDAVEYDDTYQLTLSRLEAITIDVGALKKKFNGQSGVSIDMDVSERVSKGENAYDGKDDTMDIGDSLLAKGFKKKLREKGRKRIKGCLEKGKKKSKYNKKEFHREPNSRNFNLNSPRLFFREKLHHTNYIRFLRTSETPL